VQKKKESDDQQPAPAGLAWWIKGRAFLRSKNGYELTSFGLLLVILLSLLIFSPSASAIPTALRLLALLAAFAGKLLSNSNLSRSHPGTPGDQASNKRSSLVLDAFAGFLTIASFFVP
jgi:hypothetical protein